LPIAARPKAGIGRQSGGNSFNPPGGKLVICRYSKGCHSRLSSPLPALMHYYPRRQSHRLPNPCKNMPALIVGTMGEYTHSSTSWKILSSVSVDTIFHGNSHLSQLSSNQILSFVVSSINCVYQKSYGAHTQSTLLAATTIAARCIIEPGLVSNLSPLVLIPVETEFLDHLAGSLSCGIEIGQLFLGVLVHVGPLILFFFAGLAPVRRSVRLLCKSLALERRDVT
jgi:hypothetical protein